MQIRPLVNKHPRQVFIIQSLYYELLFCDTINSIMLLEQFSIEGIHFMCLFTIAIN